MLNINKRINKYKLGLLNLAEVRADVFDYIE
jgi:hypothetical protein